MRFISVQPGTKNRYLSEMLKQVDYAIFGAGLSGLPVARHLADRGLSVAIIDPNAGGDPTLPPAGLVNPATGKRARPGWRLDDCYRELRSRIEELSGFADKPLFRDSGLLRPALDETMRENYQRSVEQYDWPDGWIRWIGPAEVTRRIPAITHSYGGLLINAGYMVHVGQYLQAYRNSLQRDGVMLLYREAEYGLPGPGEPFRITLRDGSGESLLADRVLVAAGADSADMPGWESLGIHPVKGQVVLFGSDQTLPWDTAISAAGYSIRIGERQLLVGSTYEHHFSGRETTEEAYHRIVDKVERTFPGLIPALTPLRQLSGIRVTTPNRLPVIGCHPQQERLFIATGMNSTGLLYSELTGRLLAEHLLDGREIPEELQVSRL